MWAKESVLYQIYPLGFCGAPHENDGKLVSRITKVMEWTDHFQELGISAVLFNPIFESDRHGYDTRDYRTLDVRLGTNEDFKKVCEDLHAHGIKVILDAVYNHVGRGFWAFADVLQNRENSPYKDWFYINFGGNNGYNDGLYYEGWEGHYELVKLNLQNPAVVDYLLESTKFWMEEFGTDGLRLDVAYMVDREFMKRLHYFTREINEEFFLLGEMLFGDYKQIVNNDMLDSATNYECYKGLFSSFNDKNLFEIAHSLNRQYGGEQWCLYRGLNLMNFVDNHDVSRIATILKDKKHLPLVYAVMFGMNGIPCLYYGSEWGIEGDKNKGDDDLRPCIEKPEENELTETIKQLIKIHKASPALCYGDYRNVMIQNQQLVMERKCDSERVLVAVNLSDQPCTIHFDAQAGEGIDLFTEESVSFTGSYDMPAYSFYYWKVK